MAESYENIAKMIDHALLTPALTAEQLEQGCRMALSYDVASVCILPYYLRRAAELLSGSGVRASTVIGFPHGGQATAVKQFEAERALADGGQELDMVVNLSQVISGGWNYVRQDIAAVVHLAHAAEQKVKVIFENCYLQDAHKIHLCEICGDLGVDWVKTSTGFGSGGATLEDVSLMRQHSPAGVQVKAAGGVRDLAALRNFKQLGVTRIGTSRTVEILAEWRTALGLPAVEGIGSLTEGSGSY